MKGGGVPNFFGGGELLFIQLGLIRVVNRYEATPNELDSTYNKLDDVEALLGHTILVGMSLSCFV